jgi:hypothetical protein
VDLVATSDTHTIGRLVAWQLRARHGAADGRLRVSAFRLGEGQLAYAGRAVLPGAATFATLSRTGLDLSASASLRLGYGLSLGLQGTRSARGNGSAVLRVALDL